MTKPIATAAGAAAVLLSQSSLLLLGLVVAVLVCVIVGVLLWSRGTPGGVPQILSSIEGLIRAIRGSEQTPPSAASE